MISLAQAYKVYEEAAGKGIFMSALQRSLYNADTPLTAQPWWTPEETGYERAIRYRYQLFHSQDLTVNSSL